MTLQSLFGVAGLGTVLVVTACGGGAGPLVTTTSSDGRDDPGTTRDTPPSTSDGPGGNCLQCDVVYDCPNAGDVGDGLSLSSSSGDCTQTLIDAVCSGALFGTAPCTGGADGESFTCGSIVCTPESQVGGSGSGGNSGSSSGVVTPGGGGVDAG
jgi:hypothetical protein